jgi:hypothetical protein
VRRSRRPGRPEHRGVGRYPKSGPALRWGADGVRGAEASTGRSQLIARRNRR